MKRKKHTQDRNWSVDSRWSCHNQYSLAWYRGCTWYSVPTTHGEDEHAGAPTLLEKFWRMTLLPSSMWHKISSNRGKWSKISSHRAVIASTVKCSNSVGILSTAAYRAHTGLCVQNVQVRVKLRVEAQKARGHILSHAHFKRRISFIRQYEYIKIGRIFWQNINFFKMLKGQCHEILQPQFFLSHKTITSSTFESIYEYDVVLGRNCIDI